ncbi:TPA: hypothetical protein PXN07_004017 [Yersinia enterocolitica]|nr:hypothetical protein [Yersinia enterocolitica]HDL7338710.1 hypothetical protein [Yersinia enterocolitica]
MFDSNFFTSPLFIIIIIAFFSFVILFFVIRFSVKSNDIIDLLQRILEQQRKQVISHGLIEKSSNDELINKKTLFLDEALKITPEDLFRPDGSMNGSVVKGLVNLRKKHINEISKNYGDKKLAEHDFDEIISSLSREMPIENKKLFSMEYKEHLNDG